MPVCQDCNQIVRDNEPKIQCPGCHKCFLLFIYATAMQEMKSTNKLPRRFRNSLRVGEVFIRKCEK